MVKRKKAGGSGLVIDDGLLISGDDIRLKS